MKNYYLLLVAFFLFLPFGCRHKRAVQRQSQKISVDSTVKNNIKEESSTRVDSLAKVAAINKTIVESESIEIKRTASTATPFKLYGEFNMPIAGGDTSALASQDVSLKWWINDKGKMVTLVEGKIDTTKQLTEEIKINKGRINRDESTYQEIAASKIEERKKEDKSVTALKRDEVIKKVDKQVTKTKSPGWIVWPLVLLAVIAGVVIFFKRATIWGWLTGVISRITNKFKK